MKKVDIFSEETIKNFVELGTVLNHIHNRLIREGRVRIKDGKLIFETALESKK